MKSLDFILKTFFLGLCACIVSIASANASTKTIERPGALYYEFLNETVAPAATISKTFSYVLAFDKIDFKATPSTGSMTTANVTWLYSDGSTVSSETLTANTDITDFEGMFVTVTISNNSVATATVTGNILLIDN